MSITKLTALPFRILTQNGVSCYVCDVGDVRLLVTDINLLKGGPIKVQDPLINQPVNYPYSMKLPANVSLAPVAGVAGSYNVTSAPNKVMMIGQMYAGDPSAVGTIESVLPAAQVSSELVVRYSILERVATIVGTANKLSGIITVDTFAGEIPVTYTNIVMGSILDKYGKTTVEANNMVYGVGVSTGTGTGTGTGGTVTKADIGLGSVPNIDTTNAANITAGVLPVSVIPVLPSSVLPALNITDVVVAASQAAQLALTVTEGTVCVRPDLGKSFINATGNNTGMSDWIELSMPTNSVLSVNGQTGSVVLTTANIVEGSNLYYTEARVNNNVNVLANTAARHTHANKAILDATTASFTTQQAASITTLLNNVGTGTGGSGLTQAQADAIAANTAKVGITPAQAAAIIANTAKVGITSQQASDILAANGHRAIVAGNPHRVTKSEIGLDEVPNIDFTVGVNESMIHVATIIGNPHNVTKSEVGLSEVPNTDFTADIIRANTHRNTITGNPHQVTKTEVGLGNVPDHDFTNEVNAATAHKNLIVGNPHQVTKTDVGLGNVQNTDLTAEVNAATVHKNIVSGNPHNVTKEDLGLDQLSNVDCTNASNITTGILPSTVLPPVAITDTFIVSSLVEQLALTAEKGDVVIRIDESRSYINITGNNTSIGDWVELMTPTDTILSVNGQIGTVILTTSNIVEGTNQYYTEARVNANPNVAANTVARHGHSNKAILDIVTEPFTTEQANAIVANTAKVGITTAQANAIITNTAKVGISVAQADELVLNSTHRNTLSGNPHQVTKADVGLSDVPNHDFTAEIAASTTASHTHPNKITLDATTASFTTDQADAIVANTVKVGITSTQAAAIVANTAKVGITTQQATDITAANTHRGTVTGNPHQVTKNDVGLGNVQNTDLTAAVAANTAGRHAHANKVILDATDAAFTTTQANAIVVNSAKVGITAAQADAIVANTAKVGITPAQISAILASSAHDALITGNPHHVTKDDVGLGNVPNLDFSDASNITTGVLPSSVLPPATITDTYVTDSQVAQLALTVKKGDICVRSDISTSYINKTGNNTAMSDWVELSTSFNAVSSVNDKTGVIILTTGDIAEGSNLYYTEARVSANSNVAANTIARHAHTNKAVLDATDAAFTAAQASAIVANTAKVGITTAQANAIVANTAKIGISLQQADDIVSANTHRSLITGNPHHVTKTDVGLGSVPNTDFTAAVASNTAAQHGHANKAILDATTASFTTAQANAIVANTAKVGITVAQSDAIIANTAKVGITTAQANAIIASSAHDAIVTGNPHQVTKDDIGLGSVPNVDFTAAIEASTAVQHDHLNKAILDATDASFTTQQAAAIVANTAKVGITIAQANAISANTAKVGITLQQASDITAANTHRTITMGNPHNVTKSDIGLGNVPNVDCTNASNITTGILPSSVLPPLSITDTFVVASQAAQLALTVEKGDIAVRSDLNRTYINATGDNISMTDWQELSTPSDAISSVNGFTGTVILTTSDIGEGDHLYYTEARVNANSNVAANTIARHNHINKTILDATTATFTVAQADAIIANTAKVGITQVQADAIVANTEKVGISVAQANAIIASTTHDAIVAGNPHNVTKADIGLANVPNIDLTEAVAASTAAQHAHANKAILDATDTSFTSIQAAAIAANTAKVGITTAQANAIIANTAKVGITTAQANAIIASSTHDAIITGNPHQVTKTDVGLGSVPNTDFTAAVAASTAVQHSHANKAILDAATASFTTAQANAIVANTAKVGITVAQANAIVANTAKVGITTQQATDITAANTHRAVVTGNPHAVTKADVGLGNVKNIDCTNASNITTGTLPSSVLPALAISDTFVATSQVEQLALTVEKGDICVRSDQSRTYINKTGNNTAMTDWQELSTPSDTISSVNGQTGTVILSSSDIGEGSNLYYTEARVTANVNVAANTAARHAHANKAVLDATDTAFTVTQANAIVANTAKVGITAAQASAIVANTAKVGITTAQANAIVASTTHDALVSGNPHQVSKSDVGLSNVPNTDFTSAVAASTAAQHAHANKAILDATTVAFTTTQADAIIANTVKVGITQIQADAITANTAKVGITSTQAAAIVASTAHDALVAGNPHQVTKNDVGLGAVPNTDFTAAVAASTAAQHTHANKLILDATDTAFTTAQANAIMANTAKVGITVAQSDAIVANTAKVGITPAQASAIVVSSTHDAIVAGNPHMVTKAEVGLGNVKNIDCTNASNITTGTLPSSVLPPLAISDTFVVATQAAQLALTVEKGDIAVRSDQSRTYINKTGNNTAMTDWQELSTPTDAILSVNGQTGTVVLSTTNITEGTNLYYTEARVTANVNVTANTAARHSHANKTVLDATDTAFTAAQAAAIVANTAKVGITTAQANAIVANTAKVGITTQQATDITAANTHRAIVAGNPHAVTKADVGLSLVPNTDFTAAVAASTAAQHAHANKAILDATDTAFTTAQANAIVANTAKVGITTAQSDAIVLNTAKVGITTAQAADIVTAKTHSGVVTGNPHQVTKSDIGLGNVPNTDFTAAVAASTAVQHSHANKTILDATDTAFTATQAAAIVANTAKVGITVAQANAIVANTAKVGITVAQAADITSANTHRAIVAGNPHQVTKTDVGLGNVPNIDCTNASNITTGTLPSSVLPALAITDTFVAATQVAQLALTVQKGDICVRSDQSRTYINKTGNNTAMTDWQELSTPTDTILSVNGQTGTVVLSTTNITEGTNLYYTEARVTANVNVAANTAARHAHANKAILDATDTAFTATQAAAIVANTAKVGITVAQSDAIVANTAKVGITAAQAADIVTAKTHSAIVTGNPHAVTKTDVGLGSVPNTDFTAAVAASTAAQHTHANKAILDATTASFTTAQANAIVANTAKVGITVAQSDAIVANTAKVGITTAQASAIIASTAHGAIVSGNPHQVTKTDIGLSLVPNTDFTSDVTLNTANRHSHANKTILDAVTASFTTAISAAIDANTAKVGITTAQANAIVANTAKVGITTQQATDITAANTHRAAITGNVHNVTKTEVGLGNVPNIDCTNASNITTGTLPSSVLPALAITDTYVVATQAAQLALTVQKGDIAVRSDLSKTYINATGANTAMTDWQELSTPTDNVLSVNGKTGTIVLTTSDIAEGSNLYYTEARVTANVNVAANTAARHSHANKASLDLVSGTNTGDQTSVTGNAGTATKLATARTINGVAFDGTSNITIVAGGDVTMVGVQTLTNKTLEAVALTKSITEQVVAISDSIITAANGTILTKALAANTTFTDGLSSGQSVVLTITNGSSYTITWPTITWVSVDGNVAPLLASSTVFVFWKIGTTLYGTLTGSF